MDVLRSRKLAGVTFTTPQEAIEIVQSMNRLVPHGRSVRHSWRDECIRWAKYSASSKRFANNLDAIEKLYADASEYFRYIQPTKGRNWCLYFVDRNVREFWMRFRAIVSIDCGEPQKVAALIVVLENYHGCVHQWCRAILWAPQDTNLCMLSFIAIYDICTCTNIRREMDYRWWHLPVWFLALDIRGTAYRAQMHTQWPNVHGSNPIEQAYKYCNGLWNAPLLSNTTNQSFIVTDIVVRVCNVEILIDGMSMVTDSILF